MLEVANLVTRFDIRAGVLGRVRARVHAVEDVSFSLHAGETLALVGESGCGKSTTGRSILRLVEPKSGSVVFEGQRRARARSRGPARRAPANADDLPGSVREPQSAQDGRRRHRRADHRARPCSIAPDARERVSELFAKGRACRPTMASRFPHEFSGGQRQRLCIARALALEPKLLVADEAVSALDVSIKAQVINLMMDLQAEMGLAYLFISHDIAVVERISHRVAVMYLGEIVEIGPRAAIMENPQHPYTKRLLAAVPVPEAGRRRLRRGLSTTEVPSPVHAPDYVPPPRLYREVGAVTWCRRSTRRNVSWMKRAPLRPACRYRLASRVSFAICASLPSPPTCSTRRGAACSTRWGSRLPDRNCRSPASCAASSRDTSESARAAARA